MQYKWQCLGCGLIVEVERKLVDYKKKPTVKDSGPHGCIKRYWCRLLEAPSIRTGDGYKQ